MARFDIQFQEDTPFSVNFGESGGGGGGAETWEELADKPFDNLDYHTLTVNDEGVLRVNTTNDAEEDNTLPITSAGTYVIVGNIDRLLQTI